MDHQPRAVSNNYLENLFGYERVLTKSPAGAQQWTPKDAFAACTVPDAHDPSKRHAPMMLTTDPPKDGPDLCTDREALPQRICGSWQTRSPRRGIS
jgi:hypothetical protein